MLADVEAAYREGVSFEDYKSGLRVHADAFAVVYDRLAFVREQAGQAPLGAGRILVLTEAYCIDSVLNLPLIGRLTEASPLANLRIVSRDAHAALAALFPGRGGVSRLPTVIFLDEPRHVVGHWSERSKRDHEWMAGFLAQNPMPEFVLDDGHPTPILARWMATRLASQLPFLEAVGWREVCDELAAIVTPAAHTHTPA
ncbi:MAG TPA: thioredoxin family protein [Aliidongia sp.]|uniref:thioredoxin family protein n=1 Tax=Aliidongia sp. TaxID=1914230 RepID=UPI002DDCE067|nr:thioredoxin family protein [Aliidongia sp.]HEV2674212.1 thioredoxin family protein [Aliidongia sp.]